MSSLPPEVAQEAEQALDNLPVVEMIDVPVTITGTFQIPLDNAVRQEFYDTTDPAEMAAFDYNQDSALFLCAQLTVEKIAVDGRAAPLDKFEYQEPE